MELWNKKYPDFIGYNCRITAFDLMKDKISVKADAKVNASNLFMDQDALKHAPAKKVTTPSSRLFTASSFEKSSVNAPQVKGV